jgi:hypothetical protein
MGIGETASQTDIDELIPSRRLLTAAGNAALTV